MKKINFMSVFSAKFAVTALAVVGLALTSCEKEDFSVNVPDIIIPDVDIPEAEEGITYVIVSASSSSGNRLVGEDLKFTTSEGTSFDTHKGYKKGEGNRTFTVTASKGGYLSVTKDIYVPDPQPGSYSTITVDFVLTAETEDVVPDVPTPDEITEDDELDIPVVSENLVTNGAWLKEGAHTENVSVPTGVMYTPEQITALYIAVNKLEGPVTRALDAEGQANLEKAKELLRTQIANLRTAWDTVLKPVSYVVSGGNASSLTIEVTTVQGIGEVTLSAKVAQQTYEIKGECTVAVRSSLRVINVEGEDISHSHGHGHGDGTNDGGGTAGK